MLKSNGLALHYLCYSDCSSYLLVRSGYWWTVGRQYLL